MILRQTGVLVVGRRYLTWLWACADCVIGYTSARRYEREGEGTSGAALLSLSSSKAGHTNGGGARAQLEAWPRRVSGHHEPEALVFVHVRCHKQSRQ